MHVSAHLATVSNGWILIFHAAICNIMENVLLSAYLKTIFRLSLSHKKLLAARALTYQRHRFPCALRSRVVHDTQPPYVIIDLEALPYTLTPDHRSSHVLMRRSHSS